MNALLRILRILFRLSPPIISRDEAVKIALDELAKHNITFPQNTLGLKPWAYERLRTWKVLVNPGIRPGHWVIIDNRTGEIIGHVTLPR